MHLQLEDLKVEVDESDIGTVRVRGAKGLKDKLKKAGMYITVAVQPMDHVLHTCAACQSHMILMTHA